MLKPILSAQTDSDFNKARNKALFNELLHFLSPEETKMISLGDMKKLLKPNNEVYEGLKVIPVNLIVGSESRFQDFDNHFFPKSLHLKTRWENIDRAHINGDTLPPITLYELGGLYFVRDGNHRVSVAKSMGIETLDAEVVSLQSEIKLKPGDTQKKMLHQVISYEKKVFYSMTDFGRITKYWCLDFSTTGMYDVIYNHILIHKYYINMDKSYEISMKDAISSWFNTVYLPIHVAIEDQRIMRLFHGRTYGDMYVWLVKYWDDLKQKFGNDYSIDQAAIVFKQHYSNNSFLSIWRALRRYILNIFKRLSLTRGYKYYI